ncbi:hypothetical protein [Flammeovirga sp. SubArs3]|uniref:hypothetical protein n=1 Tax=Flammeovirga sp. SubArs3 TaxID=2995316 RepID=UPI00248B20C3|nr:hypothetical protein [Flammeovirga sp. SubArs3]
MNNIKQSSNTKNYDLFNIKKEISDLVDDFLLENEINLVDRITSFEKRSNVVLKKKQNFEEESFDLLTKQIDKIFNDIRYQIMTNIMNDEALSESQKEIKLQRSLLDVFQLQNMVEEMLLMISIHLEEMNGDTKSYLTKSSSVGETFVSKITSLTSSVFN